MADVGSWLRRPGDERGFVHKRIFGAAKGAIGGIFGGPGGVLGGAARGFVQPTGTSVVPAFRAFPGAPIAARAPITCGPGFRPDPTGVTCVPFDDPRLGALGFTSAAFVPGGVDIRAGINGAGVEQQLLPFGEAVMGRFGAGMKPAVFSQQRRACPRGSVLGAPEADGSSLCYNKGDLSNKERAWPRGRRPLLTGGEMRAISTASSAAKKLQRKQKQLESLGLLKRPAARGRRALPPPSTAGHKLAVVHEQ